VPELEKTGSRDPGTPLYSRCKYRQIHIMRYVNLSTSKNLKSCVKSVAAGFSLSMSDGTGGVKTADTTSYQ
jgi:hypothetical protein